MAEEGELAIVKVAAVDFGNWTCFVRKELSPFPNEFESTEKFADNAKWIRLYNFQASCRESRYASTSPSVSVDMDIN